MSGHATAVLDQLRLADEHDELPEHLHGRLFIRELEHEQQARRTRVREFLLGAGGDDE